ncbi:NAD-dependent epimerase/dehydratase family protein [Ectothiorhodospiraceae bacterium BW-2]|nr:NAD-dependent epimerase/dehydratase family protein [Ectothiorhodospiraceae bacterium BW-2]
MANILVTGGCGFIGANLVPMLRNKGHDITILDNFSRGSRDYLDDHTAYAIVDADIRDEDAVLKAAQGQDAIIHLAAYGSVVESVDAPEENFSVNAVGTFKVLNAARSAGVDQVIFSSTGGALIGNATPPVNEQSVPRPISPYGASKLAGEGYCCAFANAYDMSITALRFANVVGPISWHKKGAVTAFFKAIMNNEPIKIYGDGAATRDFLYVEDLCRGIIAGLEAKKPKFNAYHLASGREVTIKELADIACQVASVNNHPIYFNTKRKGEVERNFANYDLAHNVLGFQPFFKLEDGMDLTWKWFLKQNDSV